MREPERPRIRTRDFVASYINFCLFNRAVVAGEFGDPPKDEAAKHLLRTLFPGREAVFLNIDAIGLAGGGVHCTTQQQPKV